MELITEKLENLTFEKLLHLKFLNKDDPINIQKCYISKKIFHDLSCRPGSTASIKSSSAVHLCRIYPKALLNPDVIEIDQSVEHYFPQKHVDHYHGIKLSDITALNSDVVVLNEIQINVIFDTIKYFQMWKKQPNELANVLKSFILKLFVFSNNCCIDLAHLPKRQKMGINKIEVTFSSDTPEAISIGKVGSRTKVTILKQISQFQYEQTNSKFVALFALERPLKRLIEIIKLNEIFRKMYSSQHFPPTKQILLVGPSGCGKSSLVRRVAQKTGCTVVTILGHEVNKSEPGETESALRDLFEQAFQYAEMSGKCIINLDEMDNLCPRRHGSAAHIQRTVSQLLLLLDKAQTIPGVIVIATTNKPDALEPSVRRHGRLETEIYIGPPNEVQRETIIQHLIKDIPLLSLEGEIKQSLCQCIASMTPGYVGADLNLLCHTIAWKMSNNQCEISNTFEFWKQEFRKAILNITPASLKGTFSVVTTGNMSFSELGGLDDIKKLLEMAILWPIKHAEAFHRLGIPRPRGVLLYGPPGCAKTSLVRALASLGTFALLSVSAAELYSPYVGDAERLISQLFQRARENSPCILFIDEIDALAGSRGEGNLVNSEVQDRIIASLLTQMDGVGHRMIAADMSKNISESDFENSDDGVIVIGATNRPDMVDAALMRPGRFDKHILVPPPNIKARIAILKTCTNKMPLALDVDLNIIALHTEFYSGADLKNICSEAAMIAMTDDGMEVTTIRGEHFSRALSVTRPSLTETDIKKYVTFKSNTRTFS